jgi:hypothetical protein
LHVLFFAVIDTPVQTTKYRSHAVLTSVATDVRLQLRPCDGVEVVLLREVVEKESDELG